MTTIESSISDHGAAVLEFKVGLRSHPALADHGFQDMIVLPGSYYLEMAILAHEQLHRTRPGLVRHARFENPVILTEVDTPIRVLARKNGEASVRYEFFNSIRRTNGRPDDHVFAQLEIVRDAGPDPTPESLSPDELKCRAESVIGGADFYGKLRRNGNQYGPAFQNIQSIWLSGSQALGELRVPEVGTEPGARTQAAALVDSITQLLAAFSLDQGRTFILKSIDRIRLLNPRTPGLLWALASLDSGADPQLESGFRGDIRVYDESGQVWMELAGVDFAFLGPVPTDSRKASLTVCLAANFTAEPIDDSIGFWADQFNLSIRTEFAPYNQVFQQLLDPGSAFSRNRDGINVLLLSLQDWDRSSLSSGTLAPDPRRLDASFKGRPRRRLPNGLEIVQLNPYETDYVYKEIFEGQCYFRHGIHLEDGATVIDIGANIGLFSLFVLSRCRQPRVYAFEPSPKVYELLKANCDAYGPTCRTFNVGVSDRAKTSGFTFYEKSSVFSSFHSDETEDREAIRAIVRNMLIQQGAIDDATLENSIEEFTRDRLSRQVIDCPLISVSDILGEHNIDRVDLLKIDAEKSELDILRGIREEDWGKIDQIVIEVHDRTRENVEVAVRLLQDRGFHCAVEEEKLLEHSGLFNIYARRDGAGSAQVNHGMSRRALDEFLPALRAFASRTDVPLILGLCPRSSAAAAEETRSGILDQAESDLIAEAGGLPNVRVLDPGTLTRGWPSTDFHDAHLHELGHIPFTAEGFAAMGTNLVRAIHDLRAPPVKVAVLDCDHTLWKGVCGEDGALGVVVDGPRRALQEFLVGRMRTGLLLCLCSKNNEHDVWDVFERHPDMILKREHLADWRINWLPKSANLRSLASSLNLGLENFLVLDDNPVECAELIARCPEALVLRLPTPPDALPSFLDRLWCFPERSATGEDLHRTRMYRENRARELYRDETPSLGEFIRGLDLRVEVAAPEEHQWERLAQLTVRTNQFNFTAVRRSENEIRAFVRRDNSGCLAVKAADRFGDYGLVGMALFERADGRCKVDTLLLSCRVLGRGVEHRLVAELGRLSLNAGLPRVELTHRPTDKNQLALDFLLRVEEDYVSRTAGSDSPIPPRFKSASADATSWTYPSEFLSRLVYDPDKVLPPESAAEPHRIRESNPGRMRPPFLGADRSKAMQRIGEDWNELRQRMVARPGSVGGAQAMASDTPEAALIGLWNRILGRTDIGLDDHFFEAGGTSLKAVQVIAAIKRELNQSLSIVSLFECPTVRLLAGKLNGPPGGAAAEAAPSQAAQRGRQRRVRITQGRSH